MPTLIDRITNFIQRLRPPAETTQVTSYERAARTPVDLAKVFRDAGTRREVVQACNEMYSGDPRAEAIVNRVADGAVRRGFTVAVAPVSEDAGSDQAEEAQAIIDALVERTNLKRRAHKLLRRAFRDGDLFLQVAVDKDLQIAGLYRMPALEMQRNANDVDEFDDPRFAYWQAPRHSAYFYTLAPPKTENAGVTWFADWQIVHARWNADEGDKYGHPLLSSARGAFKRVREGEIDMAVRRKTRAGLKYLHEIKSTADDAIERYKRQNKAALENPFAAVQDFFVTGEGSITAIQGDARLSELDDVLHHLDAFFTVSPLPLALIGYGRDINRDVLRDQYAAYLRALDEIAEWFENQVLKPLFELELLLAGIVPDDLTITVQWAEKREAPFTVEEWLKVVSSGKVTDETALRLLQKALPDFDAEAEIEAIKDVLEKDASLCIPGDVDALRQQLADRANGDGDEDDEAESVEALAAGTPGGDGKGARVW
jgi:hypothetical protein